MAIILPQISSYNYNEIKPYFQYKINVALVSYFDFLQNYINSYLQKIINDFANNIDLSKYNQFSQTYTQFYLQNYFGLSKIPSPKDISNLTKYLFDSGYLNFDSIDPDTGQPLSYDALLNKQGEEIDAYISPKLWAAISQFTMDRNYPVNSIPRIMQLLKIYYKAETNQELDIKTIKIKFSENTYVDFILPTSETQASMGIWKNFIYIQRFVPEKLGLPYSQTLRFYIDGLDI